MIQAEGKYISFTEVAFVHHQRIFIMDGPDGKPGKWWGYVVELKDGAEERFLYDDESRCKEAFDALIARMEGAGY